MIKLICHNPMNFRDSPVGVRVAEWSKAPDSSSGPRMWAWVQIPLLTVYHFCMDAYIQRTLQPLYPVSYVLRPNCAQIRSDRTLSPAGCKNIWLTCPSGSCTMAEFAYGSTLSTTPNRFPCCYRCRRPDTIGPSLLDPGNKRTSLTHSSSQSKRRGL